MTTPKVARAEFEIGDIVTYRPYTQAHIMKVINITRGMPGLNTEDDRVFYHLSMNHTGPATSITTGGSIIESRWYIPIEKANVIPS